jgi:glycosyltransferase involved in cell wall biosynthesis
MTSPISPVRDDIVLSVVAPVFNEEGLILEFVSRTTTVLRSLVRNYEIILVDDGSSDRTAAVIQAAMDDFPNLRLLRLSRNFGREIAMTAGLDNSIGDFTVVMDADLQDPPELIPALLEKALSGIDIVYAARTSRAEEKWLKKTTSRLFYKTAKWSTGLNIPDNAGDFRIFSRRSLNSLGQIREHNRYMKMIYAYIGFSNSSVPFDRAARLSGETKYNYFKLINAALDAVTSYSILPLRLASVGGLLISILCLIAIVIFLFKKYFTDGIVDGWTSIVVLMAGLFSCLFFVLAILAEYIGRILTESKNRPLYFISEEHSNRKILTRNMVEFIGSRNDDSSQTSEK